MNPDDEPAHVYIHVPFCRSRCPFCRFSAGFPDAAFSPQPDLVSQVLERTLADIRKFDFSGVRVDGLTLGGGTPSLLPGDMIQQLISAALAAPQCPGGPHALDYISMEIHPLDAAPAHLASIRDSGVRRASLGAQSFSERQLLLLGRGVTVQQNLAAYQNLRRARFDDINIDIMLGHPGSHPESILSDMETAIGLAPEHISLNTFYASFDHGMAYQERGRQSGQPSMGRHEIDALLAQCDRRLRALGFERGAARNYAQPGREDRYANALFEQSMTILAFGPGSVSYRDGWTVRTTPDIPTFLNGEDDTRLHARPAKIDYLHFTPKSRRGFDEGRFQQRFGITIQEYFARNPAHADMVRAMWSRYGEEALLHRYFGRGRDGTGAT